MGRGARSTHIRVERKLLKSPAWFALTGAATQVLMLFLLRRQMEQVGPKGKAEWTIRNNGEIVFTYSEAEKKYGITRARFSRAIKDLVRVGFIDVYERGTSWEHKPSYYSISNRWRKYGKPDFQKAEIEKRGTIAGFDKHPENIRTLQKRTSPK